MRSGRRSDPLFSSAKFGTAMFKKFSLIALVLVVASSATAQWVDRAEKPDVASGRVMVRLTPSAAYGLVEAFAEVRDPKTNLNQIKVANGALVSELLGLPASLQIQEIKPFIAQNSVVFPDVRRKMNPFLFEQHAAPVLEDKNRDLRINEDKVARWFEIRYDASLSPEAASSLLRKFQSVEIAEPRYIRRTQFTPNDSLLNDQFHLTH